ncbi:hypothetical protein A2954_06610 [Candidatus Roizmanbacteria bacterium RIFCSPLOWO2_01_FULL_37_12]|uniref:UPF0102 protein A2954_06610 n=1 Tax=Candidatus Roizmanbacteria bacterium RIFCSPLOWO2_01_FULL_37_12 TaxID=1802056 RepID=A0A1F7I8J7_9BACT|nr:MAG: hypothetical protein A3D76_02940 [Candidatus Roizmanbacteria bacterium RIFCSPHIGHO2_02_FULL_37_9b]OGK39679.1 MAG: hypothetical protein A2954_06610 [Candidatus Roizmanbacteria bacterium RIFCSPLOWO2_01_FULL_37_12]
MTRHNKDIGQKGEIEAVSYLLKNGYRVVGQNYHTHWGEIDIIAEKDKKLSFIEVKSRVGESYGKPYEAVNFIKINKLRRPVQFFLLKNEYKNYKLSLDVISIVFTEDLSVKNLKYFENVASYQ